VARTAGLLSTLLFFNHTRGLDHAAGRSEESIADATLNAARQGIGSLRWFPDHHRHHHPAIAPMILPPFSMDLGLLLISIGVVNLWRARQAS
ncbi:MAG: hypothetical protein RLZZ263_532, partial [Cyanobacteriota bacterium]